jgi:hypothetical protein
MKMGRKKGKHVKKEKQIREVEHKQNGNREEMENKKRRDRKRNMKENLRHKN